MHWVFVHGLEFAAPIGMTPEEREQGCHFRCDVQVQINKSEMADDLDHSVCYAQLARVVQDTVQSHPGCTVEYVAELVCQAIWKRFPVADKIELRLAKSPPPMALVVKEAGVSLTRERDNS